MGAYGWLRTAGNLVVVALSAFQTCPAAAQARADQVNPVRAAVAECRAGDRFLDVAYQIDLDNPTDTAVEAIVLPSVDVLEKIQGVGGQLVLDKPDGVVRAGVPANWRGTITLLTRQRILHRPGETAAMAEIPMPPALSRTIEVDLPGRRVDLRISPDAVVHALEAEGDRSRFRIIPLQGDVFTITWQQVVPARRPSYGVRQVHRVTEYLTEFSDDVTLEFAFADSPPAAVAVKIPDGVAVTRVEASANAPWKVAEGALEVRVPPGLSDGRLTVTCRLDGATAPAEGEGARMLTVPLFASPGADRQESLILIAGGPQELSFATLSGASKAATEGDNWRLACESRTDSAKVTVRIAPMAILAHATVQSHYAVSAFAVEGVHRITVGDRLLSIPSLEIVLPPGHFARAVNGRLPLEWSQRGDRLRVKPKSPLSGSITVEVTTECLTGDERKLVFGPPVVVGISSSDYAIGVSAAADVQLKTGGESEAWRVPPETLPEWVKAKSPAIGYRYQQAAAPIELEMTPVEAEIAGSIQDHVTVLEDRIRRETLFLLEIAGRPVDQLVVLLPSGLAAERVDGPGIESWGLSPDGAQLSVRFSGPVQGPCHFQLISGQPVGGGRLALRGILLRAAPHLKGWVGIGSDMSVAIKPAEEGGMNLGSVRTDQAPPYLKAFDNKLLYEFYESAWELGLLSEGIPPVYTAETLNVFGFRAGEAEASALFRVTVQQGGIGALDFGLPSDAASPRFSGPPVVLSQQEGSVWHVRFQGKQTGIISCRIDYSIVGGSSASETQLVPVRLRGAKEETGIVLLVQARPDAEAKLGAIPPALTPAEAEPEYAAWAYTRKNPALAAFTYRDTDWKLPVGLTAHPLSGMLLNASIPLAKLDTLMETGGESLNHLRLYVANTSRQFLTVDLAKLGSEARLIGTYAYGEPVKPFREGGTKLEVPLFTSEKAARFGMSVLDITYSTPQAGLRALRKQSLALPALDVNVGELEWTVRLPQGYRVASVGGNMGEPVAQAAAAQSLAGMLLRPLARFAEACWGWGVAVVVGVALCAAIYHLARWTAAWAARKALGHFARRPALVLLVAICLGAVLVALFMPALSRARKEAQFMPALSRAREEAQRSNQRANLHNIGLGIQMYRNAHGETYPPDLEAVFEDGYLADRELLHWPGLGLRYVIPTTDRPTDVVAYFWPPTGGGANVLYSDSAVDWVSLDREGSLVNPRDGRLIARAPSPAGTPVAAARAPKAFGGVEYRVDEMKQAMQMEAQMGAQAPVSPEKARQQAVAMDEALLEAHRDEVANALARFRKEHAGGEPSSADDLTPYVADADLRRAVREALARMPAVSRARKAARVASESSNMHNLGLGIAMYRKDHGGAFPPSPQTLLTERYIDDPEILEWEGQELVYRRPPPDASDKGVVAYFWGPGRPGANVLFTDQVVQWVPLDDFGNLVNPRTGELVAAGRELAKKEELPADKRQLAAARYSLGLAYVNRGDYGRAEENFRRAVELNKDYDEARQQLERTDALRRATAQQKPTGVGGAPAQYAPAGPKAAPMVAELGDLAALADRLQEQESRLEAAERAQAGGALARRPPEEMPQAAAQSALQAAQPRAPKASLVKAVGGGRSIGALPITIDFPTPDTSSYGFVKPFLGRAEATVSFRALSRQTAMLIELALAACALLGYLVIRALRRTAAMSFAGGALALAVALYLVSSPPVATLFASTALAMSLCLTGEAAGVSVKMIRLKRGEAK
jgi:tetratricopeptide (TPR) repeat protein